MNPGGARRVLVLMDGATDVGSERTRLSGWTLMGLAGIAVLVAVGVRQHADVVSTARSLGVGTTVLVVGLFATANLALAENWYRLSLAGTPLATRPGAWRIFAVSQPLRYLVPGGHIGARAAMARREGLSVRAGIGLGVIDLVLSVCVLSLFSLVTAPTWLELRNGVDVYGWMRWAALGPAVLGALLVISPRLLGAPLGRVLGGVVGRLPTLPAAEVVRDQLIRYLAAVLVRALGFVLLVLVLAGNRPSPVGSRGGVLGLAGAALGAFAVGNLAGRLAPVAPAGLGIRDVTVAAVLAGPLGLGTAAIVALFARVLDLLGELALVGGLLLVTSGRSTTLQPGSTLELDDGVRVDILSVQQRTWSNVALGRHGTQQVFCKQSLDRRGRPDARAQQRQSVAYAESERSGLTVPALVGTARGSAIEVRKWHRLQPPTDAAAAAIEVIDRGLKRPGVETRPVVSISDVMVDLDAESCLVIIDPDHAELSASGYRARLIATLLLSNWGRPLGAFVRGPVWEDASRTWRATRPVNDVQAAQGLEDVRLCCRKILSGRRREWVGVTPLQAIARFVGVHTIGRRYARRIEVGLSHGLLDRPGSSRDVDDETRRRYRDPHAAERYDDDARGPVARVITAGERVAVRRVLGSLPGPVDTWLDIAGGTGRLASIGRPGAGARRVSIDISAAMLARDESGSPLIVGDAAALPLADRSIDVAVVLRLVHRVGDDLLSTVLSEALRVARGGVVVSYSTQAPKWRQAIRGLLGRAPAQAGRSRARVEGIVTAADGMVLADVAAIPLLSGSRVMAVARTPADSDAMIVRSDD